MKIIEKEIDLATGIETVTEREMTATELAEWEANQAEIAARQEAETQKTIQKAAILEKLQITEAEAKLLLS